MTTVWNNDGGETDGFSFLFVWLIPVLVLAPPLSDTSFCGTPLSGAVVGYQIYGDGYRTGEEGIDFS